VTKTDRLPFYSVALRSKPGSILTGPRTQHGPPAGGLVKPSARMGAGKAAERLPAFRSFLIYDAKMLQICAVSGHNNL